MIFRLITIAAVLSLVIAGSAAAKPYDPERSAPQNSLGPCPGVCPGGCVKQDKQIKHSRLDRLERREARIHRRMARQHIRDMRQHEMFGGPGMAPPMGMAPGPEMRKEMMQRRQEMFGGPGMAPPMGMAPGPEMRKHMRFHNENFGPMMRPDRPMGPPQHMRFRDGKRAPRAL